jgi:protein SCO1/2
VKTAFEKVKGDTPKMLNINRRTWLATSIGGILAGRLGVETAAQETKWKKVSPRDAIRNRHLPNVPLVTHEGKSVLFYDDLMKDKIVIINMMYAKCDGICMPITMNLVKVQKLLGNRLGRDIFMYSITLKPEQDSPKALKHYAHMHKVGPGWLFLTGVPSDVELLRRKLGFVDPDPARDKDKSNHIGNLRYGNEPQMQWAMCPARIKPASIVESIYTQVDWNQNKEVVAGKGGQR